LKRTSLISGDAAVLTTLTDSSRQVAIDLAVQVVNEGIDELYTTIGCPHPNEQAESSIILVQGQRAYTLATGLVQMIWPLIDKTNNQFIEQYPGDYNDMLVDDPEQDDEGLPRYAAIRPTDGSLYMDTAPEAGDAGRIYTYQYQKDLVLDAAADTMPFKDEVFRAMVPAWVQLFRRDRQREFDEAIFKMSLGRASRLITQNTARTDYCPR
jgi:hypothetical protein